jgi:cytochrome c oxidase accessory protein FixG
MDAGPMTLKLGLRKALKHALFLVVAAIVANTFLSFFFGPERITRWMLGSPLDHPVPFAVMTFVMFGFYFDLAWFREQFCAFLCPYARFQSVMIDQDTPTVSYDLKRGEPRGQDRGKSVATRKHGDCIDCQLCVRVCPTGIDIRQGLQLECIMCARCMDACDMVMTNLGRQKGLIRISSQNELTGQPHIRFWKRPKVIALAVAVTLMASLGLFKVFGRDQVSLTIIRAPGPAYTVMPDGRYGNTFIIRATNNTSAKVHLNLEILEPKGATILCGQCVADIESSNDIRASAIIAFDKVAANKPVVIQNRDTGEQAASMLIGP